jgi:hypothetical protein
MIRNKLSSKGGEDVGIDFESFLMNTRWQCRVQALREFGRDIRAVGQGGWIFAVSLDCL